MKENISPTTGGDVASTPFVSLPFQFAEVASWLVTDGYVTSIRE